MDESLFAFCLFVGSFELLFLLWYVVATLQELYERERWLVREPVPEEPPAHSRSRELT